MAITRHASPKAVPISYEEFQALMRARSPELDDLAGQFDALLDSMQAPKVKKGMAAAFSAHSLKTVKAHRAKAMEKMDAKSVAALVDMCRAAGLGAAAQAQRMRPDPLQF